jgi:glutamine synthetase
MAVISAVDKHQDLLRISFASAGNDHRLGADEAPPAIISIYLGEELESILKSIENGQEYSAKDNGELKIGVSILPPIPKDPTDRNRTSPFAFTGNKFEFRMVGSNDSIADCNVVLNTIVAESFDIFAKELENSTNVAETVHKIVQETFKNHSRIICNGCEFTSKNCIPRN